MIRFDRKAIGGIVLFGVLTIGRTLELDHRQGVHKPSVVTECNCEWPEIPAKPDQVPTCASKPLICQFCQYYTHFRYNYNNANVCDFFDMDLRPACVTLVTALEKKKTDVLKYMEEYTMEMGPGGFASTRICRDFGCCKYEFMIRT